MTQVQTVKTYAARRRIKIGTEFRDGPARTSMTPTVDHLVPEAHLWFRQESLVHTGMLAEVEVPIEDLFAAFELRSIPSADCLAILARLGLKNGVETLGAHHSPRTAPSRPRTTRTATKELAPSRKGGPGALRNRRKPVAAKKAPAKKVTAKAAKTTLTAKATTTSNKKAGTGVMIPLRREVDDE